MSLSSEAVATVLLPQLLSQATSLRPSVCAGPSVPTLLLLLLLLPPLELSCLVVLKSWQVWSAAGGADRQTCRHADRQKMSLLQKQ
jgi:hypothetical protein